MDQGKTTDTYGARRVVLAQAKLGATPAELHGSMTGFLCAGWSGRGRELLDALALECEVGDRAASKNLDDMLERDAARIHGRLRAGEPIELALPEGPLAARADAVVDWCRGFLGGLGLTGAVPDSPSNIEVTEALAGLGQIAASHLACDDGDAAALDDLLDFIRGAVSRLHSACAPADTP